jgi:hypothetical protein
MATGIQISPSSDITVGTTAISNGTEGRVLFQGAGNVVQQDAGLFWDNTNKRLGVGITPDTSTRLDIRAQGTAFTDIAFRVRNFENTNNIISSYGNELTIIGRNESSEPRLLINRAGSTKMTLGGTTDLNIQFQSSGFGQLNSGAQGWDIISSTGDIRTRNSSTFTLLKGNFFGIGQATPQARLDVRAQGALSTDVAFRVRNSADTLNIFDVQSDGVTNVRSRIICGFSGMTSTGGALHVYAGNSSDNVARFFNTSGLSFLNIRTSSNGGVIELNDATGASGVTLNGIFSNAITLADSRNIVFGTGAGTKIASATNQRFAFWNKTPIVQPTTAIAAATFVANTSVIANDTATFDGYTIGQVVKALRDVGLLA